MTVTQRSVSRELHVVGACSGGWGAIDRLVSAFLRCVFYKHFELSVHVDFVGSCLDPARICRSLLLPRDRPTPIIHPLETKWVRARSREFARETSHRVFSWIQNRLARLLNSNETDGMVFRTSLNFPQQFGAKRRFAKPRWSDDHQAGGSVKSKRFVSFCDFK